MRPDIASSDRRPHRIARGVLVLFVVIVGALPLVAPLLARQIVSASAPATVTPDTGVRRVSVRRGALDATESITGQAVADPQAAMDTTSVQPKPAGPILPVVSGAAGRVSLVDAQEGRLVAQGDRLATITVGGGQASFALDPALAFPLGTGASLTFSITNGPGPFDCSSPRVGASNTGTNVNSVGAASRATQTIVISCPLPDEIPVVPGAAVVGTIFLPVGVQTLKGTVEGGRTAQLSAPAPGWVTRLPKVGDTVSADQTVAEIALGGSTAIIEATVPAEALLRVHPIRVQATIKDGPPTFDCAYLGITADPPTTSFASVPGLAVPTQGASYHLRCRVPTTVVTVPGLTANLLVTTARIDDALIVPRTAVEGIAPNGFVTKTGPSGDARVAVGIGAQSRDSVEITSGLSEGELVVDYGATRGAG